MKLKTLEICGFKSFVDRTVVRFDHDITGVVGPNGCGKSNIVDAIRWAMGEQSAKHLRGKHMDDVIFNGSEARGPHSFAEVTITFDNSDGLAPIEYRDYAEIAVTRRLTRDGDSGYLINKTPVRLMDVTALFLGTGVGTKAYSIIEQGRIGLIVTAKPEERRHLIEEAAGITKFKAHKQKAERKMDQTRQNLLRISDILGELDKSLASLKRQAQKAERYKAYREEQRDLELWVASHRYLELHVTRGALRAQLAAAEEQTGDLRTTLVAQEAELEAERLELSTHERIVQDASAKALQLDNAVRLLEAQVKHNLERLTQLRHGEAAAERELTEIKTQSTRFASERRQLEDSLAELEEVAAAEGDVLERESEMLDQRKRAAQDADQAMGVARSRVTEAATRIARAEAVLSGFERRRGDSYQRLERLRSERETLEMRSMELADQTRELSARLAGLRGDKQSTAERKVELEQELEQARKDVRESEVRTDQVRSELADKRSRLKSLEQIQQRFEGVGAGVRSLMQRAQNDASMRIVGLLADRLDCPSAHTQALAGALGDRLQYVVVEDIEAGASAIQSLREQKKGRATVIARNPRKRTLLASVPEGEAGVIGLLSSLVRYASEDEALVHNLLGDVLVVEDLATAQRLYAQAAFEGTMVTRQGEVLGVDGRLTGGSGEDAGAHMLEVKREIRELGPVVLRLEQEMAEAQARVSELRASIARRQAELDAARTEGHDAELAMVRAEKDLKRAEEELARARDRSEQLAYETDDLAATVAESSGEETEARGEIQDAKAARQEAEDELSGFEQVSLERRHAVEAQAAIVTEIRVRAAEARQRVQSDRVALDRVERGMADLSTRLVRVERELLDTVEKQGQTAAQVMLDNESLGERVGEARIAMDELAEARAAYDEKKHLLGGREGKLKELRQRIDGAAGTANQLTIKERQAQMSLDRLIEQVQERHRTDVRIVLTEFHARELPDAATTERIQELDRLLERMGPINLTAIDEYEEQSKRYEYLSSQKKDLETALEQLETAIRQMNRESKKLFKETFESVAARFSQIFPKMFGGGSAALKLTNPEDMLETGVEIIAQPPGKRVGAMELLSGGEKALTATSLIFALFQHKPSPFCLLDEVDAPLDEANIGRFAEAIRSMTGHSQFIVITHSKRTMEIADVLYGVTMERPGISTLVSVELRQGSQKRSAEPRGNEAQVA